MKKEIDKDLMEKAEWLYDRCLMDPGAIKEPHVKMFARFAQEVRDENKPPRWKIMAVNTRRALEKERVLADELAEALRNYHKDPKQNCYCGLASPRAKCSICNPKIWTDKALESYSKARKKNE